MKNLTYILFFIISFANAQNVNFSNSNPNFENLFLNGTTGVAFNAAGQSIDVDANSDNIIQLTEALNVYELTLPLATNFADLQGIQDFTNLRKLRCSGNSIAGNLNISTLDNLVDLDCSINDITTLILPNPPVAVLQQLNYSNNNVGNTFNASLLTSIIRINCNNNNLTSPNFDLSQQSLPVLNHLDISNNDITTFDLTGFTTVQTIDCSKNPLSNIVISGNVGLTNLRVAECTLLTSLNVSEFANLATLNVSGCNNLQSIFAKNGANTTILLNALCSSLNYICVDENRIGYIQSIAGVLNPTTFSVNSYCTPTPGGSYNTLKGNISLNLAGQLPHPFTKLQCQIGGTALYTTTDTEGNYAFYTINSGPFTISLANENGSLFAGAAPLTGSISATGSNTFIGDFSLLPTSIINSDVEMIIAPADPEAPGLKTYLVTLKNNGSALATGTMNIQYRNSLLTFIPPSLPDASISLFSNITNTTDTTLNTTNWDYASLQPFESKSFKLSFTDLGIVGPVPSFGIGITAPNDPNQSNNNFAMADAAYAPNSMVCLEGASVSNTEIGDYLHYMINFSNPSVNEVNAIIIENRINPLQFDISSLQVLSSYKDDIDGQDRIVSANSVSATVNETVQLDVVGNVATYAFRKGKTPGNPNGQGGVLLKIKTNAALPANTTVENDIRILYDYATAVEVANEFTTFASLSTSKVAQDTSIVVYPNPAQEQVTITGDTTIRNVQVYDVQGRLLETNIKQATTYVLDISNRAKGVYFLKITTDKGTSVQRLVKQ